MLNSKTIHSYLKILRNELLPATGCTEPIAIAYAAALLRNALGEPPLQIRAEVSGNIIKNVKSVIVPNTGGGKGIATAIAAGVVAGEPEQELQVISRVPPCRHQAIAAYAAQTPIEICSKNSPYLLDIHLLGSTAAHHAQVRIVEYHSNVVLIEQDGTPLVQKPLPTAQQPAEQDRSFMSVEGILQFAEQVDLAEVEELLDRQIACNTAIAEEGLKGSWGANIGSVLLAEAPDRVKTQAKAWAAAGSDARMSGCEKPVVIVSGSGNQGITASVPVICYARHLGVDKQALCRALLVSNLVTIHQKSGIGRLSAYCGAVSAGVGAGAGIAYLLDGSYDAVAHTIVNAIAILSGTICDGAKPSCAAKIAASVDAGILGYEMYCSKQQFFSGEGIVTKGVDKTIQNIGILAKEGMQHTDRVILDIMTNRCL